MSYEAGKTYEGTIVKATATESKNGTAGIELQLSNKDAGSIYHTIWLTAATSERAKKTLLEIGVDQLAFGMRNFWLNPGEYLEGKEVSFTTKEEEYNGKVRVRVEWLNGPGRVPKPISANSVAMLMSLFGVSSADVEPEPQDSAPWEGDADAQ